MRRSNQHWTTISKVKAIARHITTYETDHRQTEWFKAESRLHLRRITGLGTFAHQPAVVAYCKVTDDERKIIIENFLRQKVGSSPNSIKLYKEMREANEEKKKAAQRDGRPEMCVCV